MLRRAGIAQDAPLTLAGEDLKLVSVAIDGAKLGDNAYRADSDSLTIHDLPDGEFVLEIETEISPSGNKALSGLYLAEGIYCTQCLRVGHHLLYLLLRVESAVGSAVVFASAVGSHLAALAPRADLGELRVLLDLDAPALVVGEVPVEAVHLVAGQQVDVLLREFDRPEVPAGIEVHAAPFEAWPVSDGEAGHGTRFDALLKQLDQRPASAEEAFLGGGGQSDAFSFNSERVPLRGQHCIR